MRHRHAERSRHTAKGQSVRTRVNEIRETGRGAKGVKLVDLAEGDKLLALARIVEVKVEGEAVAEADGEDDAPPAAEEPPTTES